MQFNLTRNILENYRQQSDTIADLTVKKLTEEYNNESLWKLYQQLIDNLDELDYEQLGSTLKSYFIQNQNIPTWVDTNLVKMAEALFFRYWSCIFCLFIMQSFAYRL